MQSPEGLPEVLDPVLLLVVLVLVAVDEPLWSTEELPPSAELVAGADTTVVPPLLLPSTAALLPLPTTTGALITEPEVAFPPELLAEFDWLEVADCDVESSDEVDEPLLPEPDVPPVVLLPVPAALPAADEPPCFTDEFPPLAELVAGADTEVSPPLLLPSTDTLLPFPATTGTLATEPDEAFPPELFASFDWLDDEVCDVESFDEVDEPLLPEPDVPPVVLLPVPAALPAADEPPCFTDEFPPLAELVAGADTTVLPPLLFPSTAALLPLATTTGTLSTEPDLASPPVLVAEFDWLDVDVCDVESFDRVDEPLQPQRDGAPPVVLLPVPATLPAADEPPCFTDEFPPLAELVAGADTTVLPPLLLPSTAALLPLATTTGTLTTGPDEALPPVLFAEFDCCESEDCDVESPDEVEEPPQPQRDGAPPVVLLAVPAALPAADEPLWLTEEPPPFAELVAGAHTSVLPPRLLPSSTALLPLARTTGTLSTEPDVAPPPELLAEFDWLEIAFCMVWSLLMVLASAAVAVNTVRDPTMNTPSIPRQIVVRMCVVLLYSN